MPADIFGIEPNDHTIYLAVKQYLAHQRQGTSKSRERSEMSGSTRKLKRQKGTGTARMGDINSPVLRGGGRVFGPKPRTYFIKLNKKVSRLARKSALSTKAANGQIIVLEDFSFDAPKTKAFLGVLTALQLDTKKSLLVTPDYEREVLLSSRNIKGTSVVRAADLNTYEILKAGTIILSEGAIEKIKETFPN